jgi:hypothetical protein
MSLVAIGVRTGASGARNMLSRDTYHDSGVGSVVEQEVQDGVITHDLFQLRGVDHLHRSKRGMSRTTRTASVERTG